MNDDSWKYSTLYEYIDYPYSAVELIEIQKFTKLPENLEALHCVIDKLLTLSTFS